ncbi:MAG: hypothetical protein Q7R41_14295, partial [Phycisphaerales bacterium]|nr:hypothetical protein [Phycisphaerales bacterium]
EKNMRIRLVIGSLIALVAVAPSRGETPLGTAFTYQGQLKQGGAPFEGVADFEFTLWDAAGSGNPPTGGTQLGDGQAINAVPVTAGLFTVKVNAHGEFRGNAFNGDARWLQIAVSSPAGSGRFTTLAPRQSLTPAPYAVTALSTVGVDGYSLDAADGDPTDAVFVNSAGRVGIGTTSPDNMLHIHKGSAGVVTGYFNAPLVVENNANAYINLLTPDANERGLLFGSPNGGITSGGIIYNAAATLEGFQFRTGGNVNRMVIDSSGDVGIGTNTPLGKLNVVGDIFITDPSGNHSVPGGAENLRLLRGKIDGTPDNVGVIFGTGLSMTRLGIGHYRITYWTPFPFEPAVTANVIYDAHPQIATISSSSGGEFVDIRIWTAPGAPVDADFMITVIGPR